MFIFRIIHVLWLKIIFKCYLRRKRYALEKLKGRKPKLSILDCCINFFLK